MTRHAAVGGCWPTADQTLLLRAALLDGDAASEAREAWLARVNLDRLDYGSKRLLPLLASRVPPDSLLQPLVREEYARAASRNVELLAVAAEVIAQLHAVGIETLVLKGMALVVRGYVSAGERPMTDCDLLVPAAGAMRAGELLVAHGWHVQDRFDADVVQVRHSANFRNPAGRQIDLHWHITPECSDHAADADFWQASEPAELNNISTRTLCAADMALHACVHGLQWSLVPPVRWVVDAVSVIRGAGPAFDWARVADQAERRTLTLQLTKTLRFLKDSLEIDVPDDVFARLAGVRAPGWAYGEYRVKMRPRSRARQTTYHWYLHRRRTASRSVVPSALLFPSYLWRHLHY